jgi:hypothetical protein
VHPIGFRVKDVELGFRVEGLGFMVYMSRVSLYLLYKRMLSEW